MALAVRDQRTLGNYGISAGYEAFTETRRTHETKVRYDQCHSQCYYFRITDLHAGRIRTSRKMDFLFIQLIVLVVVGTYYVRRQLSQATPLLPLDLLRIPIFRLSILTSICSFIAQMSAMVSLPFSCKTPWDTVKL